MNRRSLALEIIIQDLTSGFDLDSLFMVYILSPSLNYKKKLNQALNAKNFVVKTLEHSPNHWKWREMSSNQ